MEQKGKRTHGHGQQCSHCWGEGSIRGLNGNGKNIIKIKCKKIEKRNAYKFIKILHLQGHLTQQVTAESNLR